MQSNEFDPLETRQHTIFNWMSVFYDYSGIENGSNIGKPSE